MATTLFRGADHTTQWYADNYRGAAMTPNVLVVHTTETADWPGYRGGATAPNMTLRPDPGRERLEIRQHFPLNRSARALENDRGGVETNTLNVIQWELVGTCDPRRSRDDGAIYWPDAPQWCYRELGETIAQLHELYPAIKLQAPDLWLPYPASYGATRARMSFAQWRSFYGICGHQHVPENVHGDPGNLPIDTILGYARGGNQEDDMPKPAELWEGDDVDFIKSPWANPRNPSLTPRFALQYALAHAVDANRTAHAALAVVTAIADSLEALTPGVKEAAAKGAADALAKGIDLDITATSKEDS